MKDIVIISAYCDTKEKENVLRNLVSDFESHKPFFDIMIISHLPIPYDISQKVEFAIYDAKNELLFDPEYRSTPWFNPGDERAILSCYTGFFNTHLAIWRMVIIANSVAKNCGYVKVHHIEYDVSIKDFRELYDNSLLMNEYDSVTYTKSEDTVDPILFGTYQSYRLDTIHSDLIVLDEKKLKDNIKNSEHKSPEKMLYDLLNHKNKMKVKNKNVLDEGGNEFGMSHNKVSNQNTAWCLPFYDTLTEKLGFVIWNMEQLQSDIDVQIIYNNEKVFNFGTVKPGHWTLIDIDDFKNAQKLITILNGKVRNIFDFKENGEQFKKVSYRQDFKR